MYSCVFQNFQQFDVKRRVYSALSYVDLSWPRKIPRHVDTGGITFTCTASAMFAITSMAYPKSIFRLFNWIGHCKTANIRVCIPVFCCYWYALNGPLQLGISRNPLKLNCNGCPSQLWSSIWISGQGKEWRVCSSSSSCRVRHSCQRCVLRLVPQPRCARNWTGV